MIQPLRCTFWALALLLVLSPPCRAGALTQKSVMYAGQDPRGQACEVKVTFEPAEQTHAQVFMKKGARDALKDAPIELGKPIAKKLTYSLILGKYSFDTNLGLNPGSEVVSHEHLNLYGRDLAKLTAIFWERKLRTAKSEEHTSLACKSLAKVSESELGTHASEAPVVLSWRGPVKQEEPREEVVVAPPLPLPVPPAVIPGEGAQPAQ